MDVKLIKENEDGSADFHVNMSEAEQEDLIRFAFIEMLKRGIEEGKKYDPLTPSTQQRDWVEEQNGEANSSL